MFASWTGKSKTKNGKIRNKFVELYMIPKEAKFNVEQHIKSLLGGLLGNFFIVQKP